MADSGSFVSAENQATRIIVMGGAELMQAFALLGFETWADASDQDVERLMIELLEQEQKAFVMLESHLAQFQTPVLKRIRETGGNIIVTEIPSFQAPGEYHPVIDNLIVQALGPNALEDKNDT